MLWLTALILAPAQTFSFDKKEKVKEVAVNGIIQAEKVTKKIDKVEPAAVDDAEPEKEESVVGSVPGNGVRFIMKGLSGPAEAVVIKETGRIQKKKKRAQLR